MNNPVKITLIAALSKNRAIGINNTLPWKLPEDLKRFRALTSRHPVIMGRKTYESIGRPLPDRLNLVISRSAGMQAVLPLVGPGGPVRSGGSNWSGSSASSVAGGTTDLEWCPSLENAIERAIREAFQKGLTQVFVIGGEQIYRLALPQADRLELTWVETEIAGDAYFPEFAPSRFRETGREAHPAKDGAPAYSFCTYERN